MNKKDLETIKTWALADFNKSVINRSDNDGLHLTECFVNATLKLLKEQEIQDAINRNDVNCGVCIRSDKRTRTN